MPTRTGHEPWLSQSGAAFAQELLRQGTRTLAEFLSEPVSAGQPSVATILRSRQTAAGQPSAGIMPTYSAVAGLTNIPATLFLPAQWVDRNDAGLKLKESERMVLFVDVPATATEGADIILPSDRVRLADPVFGTVDFSIVEVSPFKAAGLIAVRVDYARQTG